MIHLAYFSYVYVCCYVMQINYCYYYYYIWTSVERCTILRTFFSQAKNWSVTRKFFGQINCSPNTSQPLMRKRSIKHKLLPLTYKVLTTIQPTYLYKLISVQPLAALFPLLLPSHCPL